jgi:glutathione S-transferase
MAKGRTTGKWLDVGEARSRTGLRLVLTIGVPGPWGEGAKGIFHAKGIAFDRVIQTPGQPNAELVAWTGESNAPQAIYDDEAPRNRWNDIVLFAERIAPDPPLLPVDPSERATLFGLLHELCGEDGFGWSRRLMLLTPVMALPDDHPGRALVAQIAGRYGFSPEAAARAPGRAAAVVRLFARQLAAQRARGREYLIGEGLSALDIYWAAFAALIEPLPPDLCAMPEPLRRSYAHRHPVVDAALDPALLAHRDLVYERHLELPVDLGV